MDKRQYLRHEVNGLVVYLGFHLGEAACRDLSFSGLGMAHPYSDVDLRPNQQIRFSVRRNGKALIDNVKGRVVRVDSRSIGCEFESMSPEMSTRIGALIHEERERQRYGW
jgi:hypothetical protein